jgi:DNA topoisomerase-1
MARDPRARWWRREGHQRGRFTYFDAAGRRIADPEVVARLDALGLPPAWTDVRIAPSPKAKIQAVGRDAKGRTQYRYHADWVASRADAKYAKLVRFAEALPRFRATTSAHLAEEGPTRERVLALMTRLLDAACFRIGGERYCAENGSYGVATLRTRHLRIGASSLAFAFRGKKGVHHRKVVADPALAALAREVAALPGKRLFQYRRPDGAVAPLSGRDVNQYIKAVLGPEFSAKDFRTWGATLRAARFLAAHGPAPTKAAARKTIRRCVQAVAEHLGNTPAICRASYVSPRVFEAYERGFTLRDYLPPGKRRVALFEQGYTAEEMELMAMLAAPDADPATATPLRVTLVPAELHHHEGIGLV